MSSILYQHHCINLKESKQYLKENEFMIERILHDNIHPQKLDESTVCCQYKHMTWPIDNKNINDIMEQIIYKNKNNIQNDYTFTDAFNNENKFRVIIWKPVYIKIYFIIQNPLFKRYINKRTKFTWINIYQYFTQINNNNNNNNIEEKKEDKEKGKKKSTKKKKNKKLSIPELKREITFQHNTILMSQSIYEIPGHPDQIMREKISESHIMHIIDLLNMLKKRNDTEYQIFVTQNPWANRYIISYDNETFSNTATWRAFMD